MRHAATMMRRGASRPRFPADRCVIVTAEFPVYRRPSQAYVDDTTRPATSGLSERRPLRRNEPMRRLTPLFQGHANNDPA